MFQDAGSEELCQVANTFPSGSLIQLSTGMNEAEGDEVFQQDFFHVDRIVDGTMNLLPVSYSHYTGSSGLVNVRLVRSGKTNQLVSTVGNVTLYGDAATEVVQPTQAELDQMNALADALNGALPDNTIAANTLASLTSGFDLMYAGECQPFPGDNWLEMDGTSLNIMGIEYQEQEMDLDCSDIQPYVVDYLNEYWDLWLDAITPGPWRETDCASEQHSIAGADWQWDLTTTVPAELQAQADEIFSRPVHPSLEDHCEVPMSDYFVPILRRPYPVLMERGAKGGRTVYRLGELIVHDVQADRYFVCLLYTSDAADD